MESKQRRVKNRRKPKMNLELIDPVNKFILNKIYGQEVKIITYILENSSFSHSILKIDINGLKVENEKVEHYSQKIRTHRYNGRIILQTFPKGASYLNGVRFKSPYIKTE